VSTGFRARRSGGVEAQFDAAELTILRSLVSQILGLVEPGATGDDPLERALGIGAAEVPSDPVLARLFPSAYQDEELSAEFRRYTEASLREAKRADAQTLLETMDAGSSGRIELTEEQAQAWLRALNDVRLALGTRLDVTEEVHNEIAGMPEDDPRFPAFVTYDWLTYLQDTLVRALW
jgi:hypothetical protein